jgi:hypothetical protein
MNERGSFILVGTAIAEGCLYTCDVQLVGHMTCQTYTPPSG